MFVEKIMASLDSLLKPTWRRLVLFLIQCKKTRHLYNKAMACFRTFEEINFFYDLEDWNSPTGNEKILIGNVLAFFAANDKIVMVNVAENSLQEVHIP